MKKIQHLITMPVYDRPEFLGPVLKSLSRARGIEKYTLAVFVEPGNEKIAELVKGIDFCRVRRKWNRAVIGTKWNTYQCMQFALRSSEFFIHLEEDVRIAQDGLEYFEWACNKYRDDNDIFSITGYSGPHLDIEMPRKFYRINDYKPESRRSVRRFPWFTPSGWATWHDRLSEIMQKWNFESLHTWDVDVCYSTRGERSQIFPELARTQNIGYYGENIGSDKPLSEEWFWKNVYNDNWSDNNDLEGTIWHESFD